MVGQRIRGGRDEVCLATKMFPMGVALMTSWRAGGSARRLGVDVIDLYQLHWPSPLFPPRSTMPRMRRLVQQGRVAHVGVSNHNLAQWQDAERAFGGPVLSNQVLFNLVERRPERELLPWAQEKGRVIIAYSPLGQGLLSGKYQDAMPSNLLRRRRSSFTPANRARLAPLIAALRPISEPNSASPAPGSLAWLIRKPNVVAIPGASSHQQMGEHGAGGGSQVSAE